MIRRSPLKRLTYPDDKVYIRCAAVFKLLKAGVIGKVRALELLEARRVRNANDTLRLWCKTLKANDIEVLP